MHWLLILAILSSSTNLKNGGDVNSMNRMAENALRKQLGGSNAVKNIRVAVQPDTGRGNFRSFNVTLDGFSADRLADLANDATQNSSSGGVYNDDYNNDDLGYDLGLSATSSTRLSGANNLDLGDILGDILGSRNSNLSNAGRIGSLRLRATNFSYGGARYDSMDAQLGEIRFDWLKALRGDFDVKSIQPGTLSLQLRGDQAAKLLAPRLPSIQNLSVKFQNGRAVFGGRAGWNSLKVPFEASARLSVQRNQVRADDIRLSVSRLRLPSFVMNELTRGVNPLYDFDPKKRWPLAINLNTANTSNTNVSGSSAANILQMRGGVQWIGFNRNMRDDRNNERDDERTSSTRNEENRDADSRRPSILDEVLGR